LGQRAPGEHEPKEPRRPQAAQSSDSEFGGELHLRRHCIKDSAGNCELFDEDEQSRTPLRKRAHAPLALLHRLLEPDRREGDKSE